MPDNDGLITKAQRGNREALNELMSCYWQPIYHFVAYKIGNLDEAQEITQETFLRAFRALPRYQETGASFKTYLSRIAINLIHDAWRKTGRMPVLTNLDDHQELSATEDLPDTLAVSREQSAALKEVLYELPEEQRQTVELRIIAELSVKQTAATLNKSEAAIKMLQQRALKNLRKLLVERKLV